MTEQVTLRGGPTVDVDAIKLAVSLEARGLMLSRRDQDLTVNHGDWLTEPDRAAIRRLKPDLLRLLMYVAPEPPR